MDLSFLIPSKMRRKVLQYFCENPEIKVHVRELARQLEAAPQVVYRELINLENWGMLFAEKQGNQRVYSLNQRFYLLKPIQKLFLLIQEEENREYSIENTYTVKEIVALAKKTKIPESLIAQLQRPRTKPRAYDETILLRRNK